MTACSATASAPPDHYGSPPGRFGHICYGTGDHPSLHRCECGFSWPKTGKVSAETSHTALARTLCFLREHPHTASTPTCPTAEREAASVIECLSLIGFAVAPL